MRVFVPIAENFFVAPQIAPADVAAAKATGVTLIVNNRPDGEEWGQPDGAQIEQAARDAGIAYVAIPITGADIGPADLDAFDAALAKADGCVLAFCRSGTRSTLLWALARARAGASVDAIIEETAKAGYNLSGQRPMLAAAARA